MRLKRLDEASGLVQYDGDEPLANRDYYSGLDIDAKEKAAEHQDTLRGVYRTDNTDKVVRAIDKYEKKHRKKKYRERKARLGEVTAAAKIPASKISSILNLLKIRDRDGGLLDYSNHGVTDWLSTTKRKK